jgi:hypothetical protein
MADGMQKDWRELCIAVTNETDSTKLTSLVQELIEALDSGERRWRHPNPMPDAIAANQHAWAQTDSPSLSSKVSSENPAQP